MVRWAPVQFVPEGRVLLITACWCTEGVEHYDAGRRGCVDGVPPHSWWSSIHALSAIVNAGQDTHRA